MFAFSVTLSDPTARLDGATLALIQADLEGALRWIGHYIRGLGRLDVHATMVAQGTSSYLAEAGPDAFAPIGTLATGGYLMQPGPAYELATSIDPNGAADDFHILINVDRLAQFWFDPTPDNLNDRPPSWQVDFEGVMVHEVLHALGFIGNRMADGSFYDADRTPYDLAMRFDAGLGWVYDSPSVRAANNGSPVPIDSTHDQGSIWYHLALPSDLLYWTATAGVRKQLSDIDLAILHDNGLQSAPPGAGDDIWFGTDNADNVQGLSGNDHLYGLGGDDRLEGGPGDDLIDGGDGFDTAVYRDLRANFAITGTTGNRVVQAGGSEGRDTVRNVEALEFADKTLFDVVGTDATVARLYSAAFGRAPDAPGLAHQLEALHAGWSPVGLAQNFLASAEFVSRFGTGQSDDAFVTMLYGNVLNRAPDPPGYAVQIDALAHGLSRAQLLINFGDSAENQAKVATDWLLA
jgi:Domain of unknown function (DUF4214)/RTX calcium-binding nonapeptide repeat (4 copies)